MFLCMRKKMLMWTCKDLLWIIENLYLKMVIPQVNYHEILDVLTVRSFAREQLAIDSSVPCWWQLIFLPCVQDCHFSVWQFFVAFRLRKQQCYSNSQFKVKRIYFKYQDVKLGFCSIILTSRISSDVSWYFKMIHGCYIRLSLILQLSFKVHV